MTLREQIEAASAKATQEANDIAYYHGTSSKHRPQWEAYTALLDRLYRAGKLLVIEDEQEAVRRMAKGMCRADPEVRMGDANGVVEQRVAIEWKHYVPAATAALAALKGESA